MSTDINIYSINKKKQIIFRRNILFIEKKVVGSGTVISRNGSGSISKWNGSETLLIILWLLGRISSGEKGTEISGKKVKILKMGVGSKNIKLRGTLLTPGFRCTGPRRRCPWVWGTRTARSGTNSGPTVYRRCSGIYW